MTARRHLGILATFLILGPLATYPLVLHLADAVPGPPWDNFVWLYDLWWYRQTVFVTGTSPWVNPGIFYPFGYNVALSETILASKALLTPIVLLGGEVVAFNLFVLASFALSGFGTYLLVLRMTKKTGAAVIAGVIFALTPYRIHALAAGWIPLLPTQWLPLLLLYLERTLEGRRWRDAAIAGFFFALSALSSWYYAYMLAVLLPIYLVARARPWKGYLSDRRMWQAALAFVLVGAGLSLPAAWPALSLGAQRELAWPLAYVDRWSASLDDFILPNVYHPLWGDAVLHLRATVPEYPWYAPGFIALGLVPTSLAILAVLRQRTPPLMALIVLGIAAGTLALGTTLHVAGQRVYLPVPTAVEEGVSRMMITILGRWAPNTGAYSPLRTEGAVPIPLPALFLYAFLPFFNGMRHFYRFGVFSSLVVAILAGQGIAYLEGRWPGRRMVMGGAIALLTTVELMAVPLPYGFSFIVGQDVDRWLAQQPTGAAVMQFPLVRALNGPMLYRTIAHGHPAAYGHGTFYPRAYVEAEAILGRFPSPPSIDLLESWGVRYVIVGSQAYDAGWGDAPYQRFRDVQDGIARDGRLHLVATFEEIPFWREERVSRIIQRELPPAPISADLVYVYEMDPPRYP